MPKIVFIEPKSSHLHIFSVFGIPRLGTVLLGTILKSHGWDVKIYIEEIAEIDYSDVLSADLVGISTITSTAPRAYEIARQVKSHGTPVLIGGPHVTFLPEEALAAGDFVLRGEAERSILQFVDAFEAGSGFENVNGLTYRRDGQVVHNPLSDDRVELDENPIPDMNLIAGVENHRGLTYKRIVPIQTSRGCPFACTFCSVTRMFGRKMRYRNLDSVMEELARYDADRDFIFFYDDNFAVNLNRTKELLQRMIDAGLNLQWSAQVRSDIAADKQLLGLMRDAGCERVYIGFETVSDESLSLMKKAQTKLGMLRATRMIHRYGISIHGMFIFGFDTDTLETAKQTCQFAMKQKLKSVQYLILTPFPGTPLYEQYQVEDRLILKDWSFYDGHHVVHSPTRMSPVDLQWAQVKAHRRYFSLAERLRSLLRLDLYRVVVQVYAKRLYKRWMIDNRIYLKAIKLENRSRRALVRHKSTTLVKLDLRTTYNDIKERIEKTLVTLGRTADGKRGA